MPSPLLPALRKSGPRSPAIFLSYSSALQGKPERNRIRGSFLTPWTECLGKAEWVGPSDHFSASDPRLTGKAGICHSLFGLSERVCVCVCVYCCLLPDSLNLPLTLTPAPEGRELRSQYFKNLKISYENSEFWGLRTSPIIYWLLTLPRGGRNIYGLNGANWFTQTLNP